MAENKKETLINELWLKIVGLLLTILIGVVSFGGSHIITILKESVTSINRVEKALIKVSSQVEFNTKSNIIQDKNIYENTKSIKNHEGRLIKLETK